MPQIVVRQAVLADLPVLAPLLDGTRTRAEIAEAMWPGVPASKTMPELGAALQHLVRLGLMVG